MALTFIISVSVAWVFRTDFVGRFWFRISCQATFKLSARAAVSSKDLTGLENSLS